MPKLVVRNLSMSLDGYVAGPDQSLENPLGVRGEELHEWIFTTRTGAAYVGRTGGETGYDDDLIAHADDNVGAHIMGRNMFGPVRGPWPDDSWTGWWGDEPPYHHPVFVLTHHPREPLAMKGGTTFHFTSDPIEDVLQRAFDAAQGRDVRIGGGASTVSQYLRTGLVDELHLAVVPILLGGGARLFEPGETEGYELAEFVPSSSVAHAR